MSRRGSSKVGLALAPCRIGNSTLNRRGIARALALRRFYYYSKVGLTIPSQPKNSACCGCLGISSPTSWRRFYCPPYLGRGLGKCRGVARGDRVVKDRVANAVAVSDAPTTHSPVPLSRSAIRSNADTTQMFGYSFSQYQSLAK